MQISSLKLINIRKFKNFFLNELHPRLNIIVGRNAEGKTSLLEALSLATQLESFKTSRVAEVLTEGENVASVTAEVIEPTTHKVVIGLNGNRKQMKVDGENIARKQKYPFLGSSVSFVPDDLYLIKGSPERRRHFLDELGVNLNPDYASVLQRFERTLKQRNQLLKSIRESGKLTGRTSELDAWDQEFVEMAYPVYENRLATTALLNAKLFKTYKELFNVSEKLDVTYQDQLDEPFVEQIRDRLRTRLLERRIAEVAVGHSLIGPHKDDLIARLDGREARHFGSQGQIRGIVITLKIAQLELTRSHRNSIPILLLDDIISELDDERVHALVDYLSKYEGQLFVTTAEIAKVTKLHSQFSSFKLINLSTTKAAQDPLSLPLETPF